MMYTVEQTWLVIEVALLGLDMAVGLLAFLGCELALLSGGDQKRRD